jgi:hypothetical protein
MGLFYSNLTVYRPERSKLLPELRRLRRCAFVSPTFGGHTVIFDQLMEDQDGDEIERLGMDITAALSCVALASMLHDDDVLYLWLFDKGKVRDRYISLPQYFDPVAEPGPPEGGDSGLLCAAFDRQSHRERVHELLRANLLDDELPGFDERERHQALAIEFRIPTIVAGLTFSSIAGGYVPDEFIQTEFRGIEFEKVSPP